MLDITQERYDRLEVGAFFVDGNSLQKKLNPIPPVIPVCMEYQREATDEDRDMYPTISIS
jgi:hypothetical protein